MLAELQTLSDLCNAEGVRPERPAGADDERLDDLTGELQTIHDLLYRPQQAIEPEALEVILANLAAGLRELLEIWPARRAGCPVAHTARQPAHRRHARRGDLRRLRPAGLRRGLRSARSRAAAGPEPLFRLRLATRFSLGLPRLAGGVSAAISSRTISGAKPVSRARGALSSCQKGPLGSPPRSSCRREDVETRGPDLVEVALAGECNQSSSSTEAELLQPVQRAVDGGRCTRRVAAAGGAGRLLRVEVLLGALEQLARMTAGSSCAGRLAHPLGQFSRCRVL